PRWCCERWGRGEVSTTGPAVLSRRSARGAHQKAGAGIFVRLSGHRRSCGPRRETMLGKRATADSSRPGAWRDGVLLALTFAAGCVDALSYLGLSHVFTANMPGTALLLGLALGQTQGRPVGHSTGGIVGFVGGVVMAAKLVGPPRDRVVWSSRITFALGLEFLVLLVFAVGWLGGSRATGHGLLGMIVLSGLAMG